MPGTMDAAQDVELFGWGETSPSSVVYLCSLRRVLGHSNLEGAFIHPRRSGAFHPVHLFLPLSGPETNLEQACSGTAHCGTVLADFRPSSGM
jgi:hypothetical protein